MSAHEVIALIITFATCVKEKKGRRGEQAEKLPCSFGLNEAGYE